MGGTDSALGGSARSRLQCTPMPSPTLCEDRTEALGESRLAGSRATLTGFSRGLTAPGGAVERGPTPLWEPCANLRADRKEGAWRKTTGAWERSRAGARATASPDCKPSKRRAWGSSNAFRAPSASSWRTSCATRTGAAWRARTSPPWLRGERDGKNEREIAFRPARVVLQDFTGVPAVVDLARDGATQWPSSAETRTGSIPCAPRTSSSTTPSRSTTSGPRNALELNSRIEFERNRERYEFLRWGQSAFENLRVVPPSTGIVHQVNIEFLAPVVFSEPAADGATLAFPDTVVGTDSHTTMVNGLGRRRLGRGGHRGRGVAFSGSR